MDSLFLEYFYHDVGIDSIKFDFDETEKGDNKITFVLSSYADEEDSNGNEVYIKTTCIFASVYHSTLSIMLNFVGELSILSAYVDNNDECMLQYKNEQKGFLSDKYMKSINCYVISTNSGDLKIISSEDIVVLK